MRTRTLLIWSALCGLAILVAGGFLLLRLGDEDVTEVTAIGTPVEVGDLSATVLGSSEDDGELTVRLRLGGVRDDDVTDGFVLIASGRAAPALDAGPTACGATTVETTDCELRYDVSLADGTSRVLRLERGDERARWTLSVD